MVLPEPEQAQVERQPTRMGNNFNWQTIATLLMACLLFYSKILDSGKTSGSEEARLITIERLVAAEEESIVQLKLANVGMQKMLDYQEQRISWMERKR